MARTRLRGIEIAGIQMGIEVPETYAWRWPETALADHACLPRDPEVHVGVRVAEIEQADLGGERYGFGAWTFEVARSGQNWLLGLSRRGHREQLATFDSEFRTGEIVISVEAAANPTFPLRAPLDEWIVIHRTVARGGLCLTATATAIADEASVRLGLPSSTPAPNRWVTPAGGLLGRNTLLLREDMGRLRAFRAPWSDAMDPALRSTSAVCDLIEVEAAVAPYREMLDPDEAAELLVQYAAVPLCDEELFERVLTNAQKIASQARILRLGQQVEDSSPTLAWESRHLQSAFAPPQID